MKNNLMDCENLRKSSLKIREWIVKQPNVKEESLTDWLLFTVSEKIPKIYYKAFSRTEEARQTGADWEWWFLFDSYCYRMRVQAKKVKINSDNYSSLAYTNQYGLQIEKLIHDAHLNNFLPFYAFYTSKTDEVKCKNNILDEGVYLCGGKQTYDDFIVNGKSFVGYNDILKNSIPLSCFLCCPICLGLAGPSDFNDFIKTYFNHDLENNSNNNIKVLGHFKNIPNYIQLLLKSSKEPLPDFWEKEFGNPFEGVNSVLIIDRRKENSN